MSKIIGYRRGSRQYWPVYSEPPIENPLHVGGTCPPWAPLRPVPGGWSCDDSARQSFGDMSVYSDIGKCPLIGANVGDYCPFAQNWWATDEIYIFRFRTTSLVLNSTATALEFVRAYGQVVNSIVGGKAQDVVGIAFKELAPTIYQVEIVLRTPGGLRLPTSIPADAILREMQKAMGNVRPLTDGVYLQLLNPSAVETWWSKPVLWSAANAAKNGRGETDALGAGQGVWFGTAAHPQAQMQPRPDVPIAPPEGESFPDLNVGSVRINFGTVVAVAGIAAALYWWRNKR